MRTNPLTIGALVRVYFPRGEIWVGTVVGFSETLSRVKRDSVNRELRLKLDPIRTDRGALKGPRNVGGPSYDPRGSYHLRKLAQRDVFPSHDYLLGWAWQTGILTELDLEVIA